MKTLIEEMMEDQVKCKMQMGRPVGEYATKAWSESAREAAAEARRGVKDEVKEPGSKETGVVKPAEGKKGWGGGVLSKVRDSVTADQISMNKAGNMVARREFYYRHGTSSGSFANDVLNQLKRVVPDAKLVNHGEIYKPFRGGASTANSSHWWAEFSRGE